MTRATSVMLTAKEGVRTTIGAQGEAMSLLPASRRRGGGAGVETGDSICRVERRQVKQGEGERDSDEDLGSTSGSQLAEEVGSVEAWLALFLGSV